MATRTEPIWIAPFLRRLAGVHCRRPAASAARAAAAGVVLRSVRMSAARVPTRVRPPLRSDQLVEPAHLALDRLEPMLVKLERVAVQPFPGPGEGRPHTVEPLLEPGAPAFEDPQPDVGAGLAEEGEMNAEAVVFPGCRSGL